MEEFIYVGIFKTFIGISVRVYFELLYQFLMEGSQFQVAINQFKCGDRDRSTFVSKLFWV